MVNIFKDKKFLKECSIILLVGFIVNGLCFLLPLVVHAEPYQSDYFPINSGYNPNEYPIDDSYLKGLFSDPTVCMIKVYWENSVSHPDWYSIYVLHDSSVTQATPFYLYGEVYVSNSSRFDVRSSSNLSGIYVEHYQYRDGSWSSLIDRFDGQFWNFTNISSTIADPRTIYYVKENLNKDSYNGLTLIYGMVSEVVVPGDFSDLPGLDEILNNIQNTWEPPSSSTGHALPSEPTENPNNTPFQDRLQMFNYIKDSINSVVGNLGYNFKNWFDNLIGKMVEGFNSVSQNVYNGFKTLMDNIKDFFGAKLDYIIEKFNYITQEFDSDTVLDGLENTDFKQDFNSLASFHDELEDLLDIQEPSEYSLVLHLGQINDDYISLAGDQEIDISFLHNSTLFRTFVWCIVVSGLAFIVASGIPSMLRGDKGD